MKRTLLSALLFITLSSVMADDLDPAQKANRETVAKELDARKAMFQADSRKLVLPGLLADADARTIELAVEATGISKNAIVEFFLIGEGSGHDYESLFTSLATAKDLDAALKFVGMKPGRNAFAMPLSFWPRGERVRAALKLADGSERALESMVFDKGVETAGSTLPETGFVYCGSGESRIEKGQLAADFDGPCSILSTYNEPTTLLDVPRRASQNEVYEQFLANPDASMKKFSLHRLVLRPEARATEQGPRVRDFAYTIGADGNGGLTFQEANAVDAAPMPLGDTAKLVEKLKAFAKDHDAFVTLDWTDAVPCGAAADFAKLLSVIDAEDCIRVEAPKDGQLYYRAFLPQTEWRDRAERPTQPCELRFAKAEDGTFAATLVTIQEIWPEDGESLKPELKATETPVPSVEAFPGLAAANEIPALLVFAPADATLGQVMPYVRAVQATKPNVYIFVEK